MVSKSITMSSPNLKINITEAFEVGKLQGASEILEDLQNMKYLDPRAKVYVEDKLKELADKGISNA